MDHDKLIKDAQYRKGLSIAFFNATNAAISIVTPIAKDLTVDEIKKAVVMYRDYFLDEHKTYYANVIAKVGVNFKPEETKARLAKAGSLDMLKMVWQALSEDERRDKDIIAFTQALKKTYEKA